MSTATKNPLDDETLRDVVELGLWAGQLLLHAGAQSLRIERTVHVLGTALGADWLDVVVLPEGLVVTTSSGGEFRTRARRVTTLGVNFTLLDAIDALTQRVMSGELDRKSLRIELERVSHAAPTYSRWQVVFMVGLACAAFSRLFGGDWPAFVTTFASASLAMVIRQTLFKRRLNAFLVTIATAFVAGVVPSGAHLLRLLPEPEVALASSVLLLVPGVHLINFARDILRGFLVTGTARGVLALGTTLCIAIGLLVALGTFGVTSFPALPVVEQDTTWGYLVLDLFWSGVAAVGFAVLFNTPRRALVGCAVTGAIGHALRFLFSVAGVTLVPGTFLAAVAIGLVSAGLARRVHSPAGIFAVSAAIPMVPGVFAFRSMLGLMALTSPTSTLEQAPMLLADAMKNFTVTGLIMAALAVGIALPALVFRRETPVV